MITSPTLYIWRVGKTEKAMAQEKVTFYRHWGETIKELSELERLEVYDAIVQYAFEGVVKDFKSPLAMMSMFVFL